jgi:hypothetical protein
LSSKCLEKGLNGITLPGAVEQNILGVKSTLVNKFQRPVEICQVRKNSRGQELAR